MLEQIRIDNFILIDTLVLDFSEGLNVITGESASGKSLIIKAMSFLSEGKVFEGVQKDNTKPVRVTAVFSKIDKSVIDYIENSGVALEGDELIFSRTLSPEGRQSCFIQNQRCTSQSLSNAITLLLSLSTQAAQSALFKPKFALEYLDAFAKCTSLSKQVSQLRREVLQLIDDKAALESDSITGAKTKDYLEFVIKEIESANISPDEDEVLKQKQKLMKSQGELKESAMAFKGLFSHSSALSQELAQAKNIISKLSQKDSALASLSQKFDDIYYSIDDFRYEVSKISDRYNFDSDEAGDIERRLDELSALKRKYGASLSDVLSYLSECREKLENITGFDDKIRELEDRITALTSALRAKKESLYQVREKSARALDKKVCSILSELTMGYTEFVTIIRKAEDVTREDSVEFNIRLGNLKDARNVAKVASGGEISRILLSLLCINASSTKSAQVFDEIDAALGGEVANALGEYLEKLSGGVQVIAITHQASIAARAVNHIKVSKKTEGKNITVKTDNISGENRAFEIARMLSGDVNEVSVSHAENLLKQHYMTKS